MAPELQRRHAKRTALAKNTKKPVVENEIADPFARIGILIFLEWPHGKDYSILKVL